MKIQSYELQMESSYSFSQELISAATSFESFLPEEILAKQGEMKANDVLTRNVEGCECKASYNQPKTIFGIMQSLIQSLQDRVDFQVQSIEEMAEKSRASSSQRLSLYERYQENESYSFSTSGIIKTDTQEISIDIDFSMSRSFIVENRINMPRTFDPLVINYKGELPELSETRFSFDLDNDGEQNQISRLKEGSGFLALDKNMDGKINQGSELFGTILGNGFSELAQYDDDNNNWIDENDAIWDKLRIWNGADSEDKELLAIAEVGIGAIFLNAQESQFTYKTNLNETLGELRASSVYLQENGMVGTISQIDFDLGDEKEEQKLDTPLGKLLQA
ncbi:hypothetical protein JHD50_13445 [Sulfurimonas sp. MAG313]|nr:hypothetical protein [Sulfurimonas sp. MAG313]MDF1882293.1 hypothetical protein [Sulfurimonas sp. MAG313]